MARPKYTSPTQVLAYKHDSRFRWGCPRKYYYQYIAKFKQKPNIHLIAGSVVHDAIKDFLRQPFNINSCLESDYYETMQKALIKCFNVRWFASEQKFDSLPDSVSDIKKKYIDCRRMVRNWFENHYGKVLSIYDRCGNMDFAVEKAKPRSELTVVSARNKLLVRIDALEDGKKVVITDFKTSKKKLMTPEIELQLALCALAYYDNTDIKPDVVRADFLAYEDGIEEMEVTDELLEMARQSLREHEANTQSEEMKDYPCLCGGRCQKDFIISDGNTQNPASLKAGNW
jgi:hypothetical protein